MKKKTIFTIITLGLVTLLGFGFLGSYHSQPKETKASEITIQSIKKQVKITPSTTQPLQADKTYFVVAKNYSNDGAGVFYEGSISLENSAIVSAGVRSLQGSLDIIDDNVRVYSHLFFEMSLNGGVYKLNLVYLTKSNPTDTSTIYFANGGSFNRQYCAFTCTNFVGVGGNEFYSVLNQFFDIYDLSQPVLSYDFTDNFNYNNLYQVQGQEFLNRGNTPVVNALANTQQVKTYDLPWFYSNGLVFNQIKAYFYVTSYNYFQESDGSWRKYESNNAGGYYLYFHHLEYVNKATNYSITACNRIIAPYHEAGWTAIYRDIVWTSKGFQHLDFQSDITNLTIKSIFDSLSSNILGGFTEITIQNDIDLGLGSAFTLLSQAFTAWLPILSVSIIPGISLGLLLFLPLIAGIIILIIWIVKR